MKTNLEPIAIPSIEEDINTYGVFVGLAEYICGYEADLDDLDVTPIIEYCEVYDTIEGMRVAIAPDGEIVHDYRISWPYPEQLPKRGKHSKSNNKEAQRIKRWKRIVSEELPF